MPEADFKDAKNKATESIMKKLFRDFDTNQSGYVDFDEFHEMTYEM
jgi:Ca2+-binding EF-hand superfamily protein